MYTEFYQLADQPFRLTPDPRFLQLPEPHRIALTNLLSGIIHRKGIIVATGAVGTGKTTLLHAMLHLISTRTVATGPISSAFVLNPVLSREELLEAIIDEFEIKCTGTSKPRRLAALSEMLLSMQRKGGTAVLIIDEAHLLTPELLEEIRLLTNADTHQEKLLQVILSGQPELLPLLRRPEMHALKQRIASRSELRPLSLPETRVYITERLHAAGLRGQSMFTASALESAHKFSSGVPRLINLLCDQCLTIGCTNKITQVGTDIVEEAAVILDMLEPEPLPTREESTQVMVPRNTLDLIIEALKQDRVAVETKR
jgi:general secretion pathway protein A